MIFRTSHPNFPLKTLTEVWQLNNHFLLCSVFIIPLCFSLLSQRQSSCPSTYTNRDLEDQFLSLFAYAYRAESSVGSSLLIGNKPTRMQRVEERLSLSHHPLCQIIFTGTILLAWTARVPYEVFSFIWWGRLIYRTHHIWQSLLPLCNCSSLLSHHSCYVLLGVGEVGKS